MRGTTLVSDLHLIVLLQLFEVDTVLKVEDSLRFEDPLNRQIGGLVFRTNMLTGRRIEDEMDEFFGMPNILLAVIMMSAGDGII